MGVDDIKLQTKYVLENLKNVTEAAGASFSNVVKVNIFVTDLTIYGDLNEVYEKYFQENKPARSCVQVVALPVPNAKVEIEAVVLA
ncbi:Piso0_004724 [Millerozyma farinosa CBS 7064]|uniref:Piso0_004724 protein n=1 Tax=Pichia sorbitophila (strain ATCC MYA-4447 / BCRC 22081 / CBS 7064 / NBRC 10061 / NRRL Y-12695) TaxID=559304 RepID=G8Y691_PICSO|nr:Piso0_004724 [Millerozyma farinosa CBS 7064]CCE85152.1 Piso0_004724 [Millerozyma farinosa CBS 7064]